MPTKRWDGKVAIVNGSSKGLGAAIARYFSSGAEAEKLVNEIDKGGGNAVAVKASMRERSDIAHLFKQAHDTFGTLDILVNNAGVYDLQPDQERDGGSP